MATATQLNAVCRQASNPRSWARSVRSRRSLSVALGGSLFDQQVFARANRFYSKHPHNGVASVSGIAFVGHHAKNRPCHSNYAFLAVLPFGEE
jgi:hypothetical protein